MGAVVVISVSLFVYVLEFQQALIFSKLSVRVKLCLI